MPQDIMQTQMEVKQDHTFNARIQSNMLLMLSGKFVSLFGTYLYSFAISLYILRETGSGMSFAATLIFGLLPRIILAPIAGAFADRLDRKKMVVGMDIASGLVVLGLWLVTAYSGLHVWYIYVTAVLLAVCNTFFSVAMDASIPNLVDQGRLMRANSLSSGIASLTQIAAPMVGGMIYGFVDLKLFLLVNGISFVLSGISEMFIHFDLVAPEEGAKVNEKSMSFEQVWQDMKEGFVYLRGQELIFTLFLFAIFINFFFNLGLAVPLPYIINNVLQLTPTQFGIIEGAVPIGLLAGSILLSVLPEFKRKYKVISISLVVLAGALASAGLPAIPAVMTIGKNPIFIFYTLLSLGMGFTQMLLNMPVWVMLQRETPNHYRGRVFGLIQTMAGASTPLGFLLAGILIEITPAYVLPIATGFCTLFLVGLLMRNKALRQM